MRVLFVCHGKICRSAMAEFILKARVKARGLDSRFHIESAAVSSEEIGNPIYPPHHSFRPGRKDSSHDVLYGDGTRRS